VSRLITSVFYGVTPTDPVPYAGVSGILLLVALIACVGPAWRAARVDPLQALRQE